MAVRKRRGNTSAGVSSEKSPVLVDGHYLLMRNLMGTVRDDAKAQTFTGGTIGFISQLSTILRLSAAPRVGPILVAFDTNPPPYRFEMVPNYKDRPRQTIVSEDDMRAALTQLADLCDILPLLGVKVVAYADREADDVVAAGVRIAVAHGDTPIAVSGDKDLYQVVEYGASLVRPGNLTRLASLNFEDEVGVPPEMYVIYKCLVGDANDGMKGAPGVGHVNAQKLVKHYSMRVCADKVFTGLRGSVALFELFLDCIAREQPDTKTSFAILENRERLLQEMRCLDLRDSFGPTKGLERNLYASRSFEPDEAWKQLSKLKCQGLLKDWERVIEPYRKAALLCA